MGSEIKNNIVHLMTNIMMAMYFTKYELYEIGKFIEYYFKFGLMTSFAMLNSLILLPLFIKNGKNVQNARHMAEASKGITKILGVTWTLRNPEIVSQNRSAIIIINHQSHLDFLGLCQFWDALRNVALVVKKEMFYFWPLGLALHFINTIFVDKKNPKEANEMLQTESKNVLQNKNKLLVFPEGTRNSDFTKLLPLKKGAFNLAVETQVPIIPIVVSRYYFLNHKRHIFNSGEVIAQCLDPISTEGLTMNDVPDLINKVENTMAKTFKELSNEVTKDLPAGYPLATKASVTVENSNKGILNFKI